jgi:uncharacterized protein involved in exopolysaccharide biosynthesis
MSPTSQLAAGNTGPVAVETANEDRTISVLDLMLVAARGKRAMLWGLLIGAVVGLIASALTPNTYKAKAEILPPSQVQSTLSAIVGSLTAGATGSGTTKDPSDLWVGLFRSHGLQQRVVQQNELMRDYKVRNIPRAIRKLDNNTEIEGTKQGLIDLTVTDHDPNKAAAIANSYIDSLKWLNDNMAISEAAQRRLFWQQELERQKNALADEEAKLATIEHSTGLISMGAQENAMLTQITSIRAEITNRQVQLAALNTAATADNPEVKNLEAEIATLQESLKKLEAEDTFAAGSVELTSSKVPELQIQYVRQMREVKYHEVLFELGTRQYEAAKIDESRAAPIIQVVDRATPPISRTFPIPWLFALLGGFLGFAGAAGWIIFRATLAVLHQKAGDDEKLKLLRQEMRFLRS